MYRQNCHNHNKETKATYLDQPWCRPSHNQGREPLSFSQSLPSLARLSCSQSGFPCSSRGRAPWPPGNPWSLPSRCSKRAGNPRSLQISSCKHCRSDRRSPPCWGGYLPCQRRTCGRTACMYAHCLKHINIYYNTYYNIYWPATSVWSCLESWTTSQVTKNGYTRKYV